jgi:hypothetical protein
MNDCKRTHNFELHYSYNVHLAIPYCFSELSLPVSGDYFFYVRSAWVYSRVAQHYKGEHFASEIPTPVNYSQD